MSKKKASRGAAVAAEVTPIAETAAAVTAEIDTAEATAQPTACAEAAETAEAAEAAKGHGTADKPLTSQMVYPLGEEHDLTHRLFKEFVGYKKHCLEASGKTGAEAQFNTYCGINDIVCNYAVKGQTWGQAIKAAHTAQGQPLLDWLNTRGKSGAPSKIKAALSRAEQAEQAKAAADKQIADLQAQLAKYLTGAA